MIRTYLNTAKHAFKHAHIGANTNQDDVLKFATADGSATININFRFPVGKTITVKMGDGNSYTLIGNGSTNVNLSHSYGTTGSYEITFEGDYTDLTYIFKSTLQGLTINVNNWSGLINLDYILLRSDEINGDFASFRLAPLQSYLEIRFTSGTLSCGSQDAWTSCDCDVILQNNGLSSASVDNILIGLAAGVIAGEPISLNINSPRTSASDAAVVTLTGRGCTITTS